MNGNIYLELACAMLELLYEAVYENRGGSVDRQGVKLATGFRTVGNDATEKALVFTGHLKFTDVNVGVTAPVSRLMNTGVLVSQAIVSTLKASDGKPAELIFPSSDSSAKLALFDLTGVCPLLYNGLLSIQGTVEFQDN